MSDEVNGANGNTGRFPEVGEAKLSGLNGMIVLRNVIVV